MLRYYLQRKSPQEKSLNKKLKRIVLLAVLIVMLAGSLLLLNRSQQQAPSDLAFKIIDGQTLSLEEFRGQPVLIDFWATSCRSCMHELPDLITLYHELSAEGLQIIGVAMSYDRPDLVLKTSSKYQIPYPVALDINGEIAAAFGRVDVTPTHFLISPDGNIAERIIGAIDPVTLRDKIKAMFAQKPI